MAPHWLKVPIPTSIAVALVLAGHSKPVLAATYFVDNSGSPACSNGSSYGSEVKPWCTLTYAATRISAGDKIYVKAGTYNETAPVITNLSATPGTETRIENHGDDVVTIRSTGYGGGQLIIDNCDHLILDGINFTNGNSGLNIRDTSSYITIQNLAVYDVGQHGIAIHENSHHVTIDHVQVYRTGNWTGCSNHVYCNGEGVYIGTASDVKDYSHDVTIRRSTFHSFKSEAIDVKYGVYNVTIEDNLIHSPIGEDFVLAHADCYSAMIYFYPHSVGTTVAPQEPKHIVRRNIIRDYSVSGRKQCAIGTNTSTLIYNNLIYDMGVEDSGIFVRNVNGDKFVRRVYHNTIDLADAADAVIVNSGIAEIKNNIGPVVANNVARDIGFFVSVLEGSADYSLKAGAAAIDHANSADVTAYVNDDYSGGARDSRPDMGAFEYRLAATELRAPEGLRFVR
jgi:hypothetical protein